MTYRRKTDQNFPVMRAAEVKRRRRREKNLELAARGIMSLTMFKTLKKKLWTPKRIIRRADSGRT